MKRLSDQCFFQAVLHCTPVFCTCLFRFVFPSIGACSHVPVEPGTVFLFVCLFTSLFAFSFFLFLFFF